MRSVGRAKNINDIAQKARVSVSTVSRVINGSKPVSEELKRRVLAVMKRENYFPSHPAQSVARRRTHTIGVVVPKISASFHSSILEGIDEAVSEREYQLVVCRVGADSLSEVRYLDMLSRGIVDGIVLMEESASPKVLAALRRVRMPVVLATVAMPALKFPTVRVDDFTASRDATRHLLSLGHRSIGLIAGTNLTSGEHRTAGYLSALAEYGVPRESSRVSQGSYSFRSGYEGAQLLFERASDLTGLFAVSDEMALGAIRYLHDRGRAVPEEVSVVGFDDIDAALYCRPRLTTVNQPARDIGRTAGTLLLDTLASGKKPMRETILPHRLVIRQSTAPPCA